MQDSQCGHTSKSFTGPFNQTKDLVGVFRYFVHECSGQFATSNKAKDHETQILSTRYYYLDVSQTEKVISFW